MRLGYRESAASWAETLRDLRDRGLDAPLLAVGDGALGLWAALAEVFPATRHQRCTNHKDLNVIDRLPKRLESRPASGSERSGRHPRARLRETERERRVLGWLHAQGQPDAAATLLRDWDDLVTFYDFPAEHWIHLRTSNVVESVFSGVRGRTRVAQACPGSARTRSTWSSRSWSG